MEHLYELEFGSNLSNLIMSICCIAAFVILVSKLMSYSLERRRLNQRNTEELKHAIASYENKKARYIQLTNEIENGRQNKINQLQQLRELYQLTVDDSLKSELTKKMYEIILENNEAAKS